MIDFKRESQHSFLMNEYDAFAVRIESCRRVVIVSSARCFQAGAKTGSQVQLFFCHLLGFFEFDILRSECDKTFNAPTC